MADILSSIYIYIYIYIYINRYYIYIYIYIHIYADQRLMQLKNIMQKDLRPEKLFTATKK